MYGLYSTVYSEVENEKGVEEGGEEKERMIGVGRESRKGQQRRDAAVELWRKYSREGKVRERSGGGE